MDTKSGPPPAYGEHGPSPGGYPQQPPPPGGGYPQQPPPAGGYAQPPPPAGYGPPPGQYQQQPGMYQQPPPGGYPVAQTVIVNQPLRGPSYGPSPTTCACPYCHAEVTTTTSKRCGAMVWIVAGVICLIGLFIPFVWLGCCFIPFCIPSLYDTEHICPNCQRQMGVHKSGGL